MPQDTIISRKIVLDRLDEIKDNDLKELALFLLSNSNDIASCAAKMFFYINDKSWEKIWPDELMAFRQLSNLWLAIFGEIPGELIERAFNRM